MEVVFYMDYICVHELFLSVPKLFLPMEEEIRIIAQLFWPAKGLTVNEKNGDISWGVTSDIYNCDNCSVVV